MATQNRPRCSRPATGGRPGENKGSRPDRSDLRFRLFIATSHVRVLRRPFESAEYAYDRQSKVGQLDKALEAAALDRWTLVDMKRDWKTVFAFGP